MSHIPPPPNELPEISMGKTNIGSSDDELSEVSLRKVNEKEKHYVSLYEVIQKFEKQEAEEKKDHYKRFLDEKYSEEYFDEEKVFKKKCKKLSKLIKKSKHFVVFTGAGISTSAGIPDFRSPNGEWTLLSKGEIRKSEAKPFTSAFPTFSHMSLVALQNSGKMKYLISQNCDGLHLRSGILRNRISELHGNVNIEICEDCGREHYRDYSARRKEYGHDHFTGRFCHFCGSPKGKLLESTVDFDQSLPETALKRAWEETKRCDLMLVLGSSCQVNPAALMPKRVGEHSKKDLVVVNIQKTPVSDRSTLNIHGQIDEVMKIVMKELKMIPLPKWKFHRKVLLERKKEEHNKNNEENSSSSSYSISIRSLLWNDSDIFWTTMFKTIIVEIIEKDETNNKKLFPLEKEPFEFTIQKGKKFKLTFVWMKHYGEKNLTVEFEQLKSPKEKVLFEVTFDPYEKKWIHIKKTKL